MRTILSLAAVVALASVATAAPLKVALFPPGTSAASATAILETAGYDALPSCQDGVLPCGTQATKKSRRIWTGTLSADGETCERPTAFPLFEDLAPGHYLFSVRVTKSCGVRLAYHAERTLHFPPGIIRTLTTLSFGDMQMGVYFQPNVARGQKIKRVIFARGAVRKNGYNWTRNSAGAYVTEQWLSSQGQPAVYPDSWIIDSSVSGTQSAWRPYLKYPYTPQAVALPYQVGAELVGSFINTAGTKTHWSDVLAAVGNNQQKTFRCSSGGDFPVASTFVCELYFNKVNDPSPI